MTYEVRLSTLGCYSADEAMLAEHLADVLHDAARSLEEEIQHDDGSIPNWVAMLEDARSILNGASEDLYGQVQAGIEGAA